MFLLILAENMKLLLAEKTYLMLVGYSGLKTRAIIQGSTVNWKSAAARRKCNLGRSVFVSELEVIKNIRNVV